MVKTAFVHIGMPKAGSSGIQHSLAQSRDELRKHGFVYPGGEPSNRCLALLFQRKGPSILVQRNRSKEQAVALVERERKQVEDEIRTFDGDVILSSESFSAFDARKFRALRDYLSGFGYGMRVICYVRHPIGLAVSHAQQRIKQGKILAHEAMSSADWRRFSDTLAGPMAVFDRKDIIVRSFEAAAAKGTPHDLLEAIAYPGPLDRIPDVRKNPSLTMAAAYLADGYERLRRRGTEPEMGRGFLWNVGGEKFGLPEAAIAQVREECQDELAWLRDTFGIELPEPTYAPTATYIEPEAAMDIVTLIANRRARKKAGRRHRPAGEAAPDGG